MRIMTYPVLGLILLSVMFIAGNSFSQNVWYEAQVMGYAAPAGPDWVAFRASDMLGAQLTTFDALYLAQICGFEVNTSAGTIDNVALCDVKGMGGEKLYVPFSSISRTGNAIYVFNDEPDNIYRFKGATPYGRSEGFTLYAEGPYRTEAKAEYSTESMPMEGHMEAHEVSVLIGASAHSSAGEDLGRVDDFVIDPNGHIIYVVLIDAGGTEGRYAAVPFGAASISSGNILVFNTTRETLVAAPVFDWRDISNRGYAKEVYIHFGLHPYWE